jgi:hypothetical protein
VRRLALLLLAAGLLAGCGSSSSASGTDLYAGGDWKVVLDGDTATAYHRVEGDWRPDRSNAVKIRILGPEGKAPALPQVAVELSARRPLIESGLWVDGEELLAKGGGLTSTKGTIYGAPAAELSPGKHVAVAYGRTETHAHAVAWTFTV